MPFVGRDLRAIHGLSLEKFCKKYDLVPFTGSCEDCGREKTTSIPARGKNGYVGLLSPPCECGSENIAPYVVLCGMNLSPDNQAKK